MMNRKIRAFVFYFGVLFCFVGSVFAQGLENRFSKGVVVDTGNTAGGFDVTVTTATPVLLSDSGTSLERIWRKRTFQVTGTSYDVWIGTHSAITFNSGAGWLVSGSTGTWTTNSSAAFYGILDPAAAAGTAVIHGPFEYQSGEKP